MIASPVRTKYIIEHWEEMQRVARSCQGPLPDIGVALDRIAAEWSTLSMATGGRAAGDLNELGAARPPDKQVNNRGGFVAAVGLTPQRAI